MMKKLGTSRNLEIDATDGSRRQWKRQQKMNLRSFMASLILPR